MADEPVVFLPRTFPRDGESTVLQVDNAMVDLLRGGLRILREHHSRGIAHPLAVTMDAGGTLGGDALTADGLRCALLVAALNHLWLDVARQLDRDLIACGAVFCYAWINDNKSGYTDRLEDATLLMAWLMKKGRPIIEVQMPYDPAAADGGSPFGSPTGEAVAAPPLISGQHVRWTMPPPEGGSAGVLCCGAGGDRVVAIHRGGLVERWDPGGRGIDAGRVMAAGLTTSVISGDLVRYLTASHDGKVALFNAESREEMRRVDLEHSVPACALDGPGRRALVCRSTGELMFWDVESGDVHRRDAHADVCAMSGDGARAITGSADGPPLLWEWPDPGSPEMLYRLRSDQGAATAAALSADGSAAVTASADGKTFVWDLAGGRARHSLNGPPPVYACALTRDGQFALTAHDNVTVLWDAIAGTPLQQIAVPGHHTALAFAPDGASASMGAADGTLTFLELFPS